MQGSGRSLFPDGLPLCRWRRHVYRSRRGRDEQGLLFAKRIEPSQAGGFDRAGTMLRALFPFFCRLLVCKEEHPHESGGNLKSQRRLVPSVHSCWVSGRHAYAEKKVGKSDDRKEGDIRHNDLDVAGRSDSPTRGQVPELLIKYRRSHDGCRWR